MFVKFVNPATIAVIAGALLSMGCFSTTSSPRRPTQKCLCPNETIVETCSINNCAAVCTSPHGALDCNNPLPAGPQALTVSEPTARVVVLNEATSFVKITSGSTQTAPIPVKGIAKIGVFQSGEIQRYVRLGRLELTAPDFTLAGKTVRSGTIINSGVFDAPFAAPNFTLPHGMLGVASGLASSVPYTATLSADRDVNGTFNETNGQFRIWGTLAQTGGSVTFDVSGQARPVGSDIDTDGVPDSTDTCPSVATTQSNPTGPTITAPAPVTFSSCGSTSSIGMATAQDSCGTGTVSISNNAPERFLPGQTVVTWTATDGAGNTRTATQLVTVAGDSSCCPAGTNIITGTSNNDVLNGTSGNDCILGLGGQDTIHGGGGNDYIVGGDGDDRLYGEDGNDTLAGGTGQDRLEGGNGNDVLKGSDGDDSCWGGPGDDDLQGGQGQDTLNGEGGNDRLNGEDGYDTLNGGVGTDVCTAGGGIDTYLACETSN